MAEGEWTEWRRRRSVVSCECRGGREGTVVLVLGVHNALFTLLHSPANGRRGMDRVEEEAKCCEL